MHQPECSAGNPLVIAAHQYAALRAQRGEGAHKHRRL